MCVSRNALSKEEDRILPVSSPGRSEYFEQPFDRQLTQLHMTGQLKRTNMANSDEKLKGSTYRARVWLEKKSGRGWNFMGSSIGFWAYLYAILGFYHKDRFISGVRTQKTLLNTPTHDAE